jgi:hypothetical protein
MKRAGRASRPRPEETGDLTASAKPLFSGPRSRCYIGQYEARLRKQAPKRIGDRAIPFPSANERLEKHRLRSAPHNQSVEGTHLCLERDYLFVFLVYRRAMIQTDQHAEIVAVSPTSGANEVSDLEREALWQTGRGGDNAALCQIAHNPAQTASNPLAIVSAVRCGAIPALLIREAIRFEAIERIETPGGLRNFRDSGRKKSPWEAKPPTAQV